MKKGFRDMDEKLEQAATYYTQSEVKGMIDHDIDTGDMKRAFKAGANWQKEQSPWISVKEQLPPLGEEVLLFNKRSIKRYEIGWLREKKGYCKSKWFVTNGYVTDDSITHWMPIVEPK